MTRLRSIALTLLLLTAAIAPGAGTAVAAEQGDCSSLDDFVMFLTLGAVNAEDCSRQAYVDDAVQDMRAAETNQTKTDIYSGASSSKAGFNAWAAPYDNYLSDTESVAWMKAQVAIANAYKNGSSKATAKVEAREAIADYYATKQVNLIEQWNQTVSELDYLEQTEQQEGISETFFDANGTQGVNDCCSNSYELRTRSFNTAPAAIPLTNGSTRGSRTFSVGSWYISGGSWTSEEVINVTDGKTYVPAGSAGVWRSGEEMYFHDMLVKAPNTNYDDLYLFRTAKFADRMDRIESKNSALQAEAENYVNATWEDFESGKINASDVVSSHTAMFEYGVRSGNESEGLYRSTAALALMGYDTPNMSSTGMMNVTYRGVSYTGLVLAAEAPNGTWQTGVTYSVDNFSSPVFMATSDGRKIDFASGETFTISDMTARDGSTITESHTTKYVYKTANTSQLLQLQEDMLALRQSIEYEQDQIGSGGGGGGSSGFDWQSIPIEGLVLLAALAFFALKD
jgi:hypothetical protein